MKIVLTGGTGFIGKPLLKALIDAGHSVVLLSRSERRSNTASQAQVRSYAWNGRDQGIWSKELDGADAVINLAGEPIAAKRWTAAQKRDLVESRVAATAAVVEAIRTASKRPTVLINASAVGFYGNVPDGEVGESHPKGNGFLSEVCAAWEAEAQKAQALGVRTVLVRIGVVLEKGGGALEKFIPPFTFFAGGPLGSGKQWFPWIHRDDVVGVILFALKEARLSGPVNAAAPESVTMSGFCKALGSAMGRPSWAPVPSFALRLLLGEMSDMLTGGQRVVPQKLKEAGYRFKYPGLKSALTTIFKK